jgi:hypothetical protein
MVPSETTLDKTAPGLELNSLEAIICIGTPFAQQMPEVNKNFRLCLFFAHSAIRRTPAPISTQMAVAKLAAAPLYHNPARMKK